MNIGIINSSQSNVLASAGIFLDAVSAGTYTAAGTSITYSHTCSGANRILFVAIYVGSNTDVISSVTYNGVSMTIVNKSLGGGTSSRFLYALLAPTTGTHDVVVTISSSVMLMAGSISYTGVNQASQPDASNVIYSSSEAKNIINTITTTNANSYTILFQFGINQSIVSGSTLRATLTSGTASKIYDSGNAIALPGSHTMTISVGNYAASGIIASFSPAI